MSKCIFRRFFSRKQHPLRVIISFLMTLRGWYEYVGSLTRPVTIQLKTGLRTPGAKRPRLHLWGVAERSESFKIMIAGGNHTSAKSCQPKRADFSARRRYASEQPPQAALSESQRGCRALAVQTPSDLTTFGHLPFPGEARALRAMGWQHHQKSLTFPQARDIIC